MTLAGTGTFSHFVRLICVVGHRNKTKRKKDGGKNKKVKKGLRDLKPFRARKKRRLNRTRPFLIVHTKVNTYIRSKRDAVICRNNSICCKIRASAFLLLFLIIE
jgi:hypothetical protein